MPRTLFYSKAFKQGIDKKESNETKGDYLLLIKFINSIRFVENVFSGLPDVGGVLRMYTLPPLHVG